MMLLGDGIWAPCKILEAYIDEVGWHPRPIGGQNTQPLWALAHLGTRLPSMAWVIVVLIWQRDNKKIGLPWMEVHIVPLAIKKKVPKAYVRALVSQI